MKTKNFDEIGMSDFSCEGDYFEKIAPVNGKRYSPEEINNLMGSSNWRIVTLPTNDVIFYNHETIAGSRNYSIELFVAMSIEKAPCMYGIALVIDGQNINPLVIIKSNWGMKMKECYLNAKREILLSEKIKTIHPKNKKDYSLQECQSYVGGPMELVNISEDKYMVVNEEGALRTDFGVNLIASAIAGDIIFGDVMIIKKSSLK